MPRPKNADAKATRARILSSAAALFAAAGHGSTSVRAIAGAAGVSLATVHHYFGSKDELYKAAIDAMYLELDELRAELEASAQAATSPAELLDSAVRRTFRFARAHQSAVRLVMRAVLDTGEVPEERRSGYLLPLLDEGAAMIAALTGQEQTRVALNLHSLNQLIVRYALVADVEAGWIQKTVGAEGDPLDMLEDQLVFVGQRLLLP